MSAYREYLRLTWLGLSVVAGCTLAGAQITQDGSNPTKPSASVSFERQTIRENDSIPVDIWFSNEWQGELKTVDLYIAGPNFMIWLDQSSGGTVAQPIQLGPVAANSIVTRTLLVKTKADPNIGNYSIAFTFKYEWEAIGGVHKSFVLIEKPLNSTLLGSESVAGVPLNLPGYVLPGLFFWLVLGHLKVPRSVSLGLGERMIYSFVVSLGIVWLAEWLKIIDSSRGISITKLAQLAALGPLKAYQAHSEDRPAMPPTAGAKRAPAASLPLPQEATGEADQRCCGDLLSDNAYRPCCSRPRFA